MFTATTGGIAQTSTSPVVISRRMKLAELREQERDQRPEHHRQPTVTAVNADRAHRARSRTARSWKICE